MPSAQQPPKAINEKNEKNEKSPATSPIFAVAKAAQIRHEVMIPMEYGIKLLQMSKEETAQANLPFPLMWRLWLGSDIV
jgi:hypothetical protein